MQRENLQRALYFAKQGPQNLAMGDMYDYNGQFKKAVECYSKALEIAKEVGYRKALGVAFGNLGNTYHKAGQYQKAIDYLSKALKIAEEIGDCRLIGLSFGNMGNAYHSIGQFQKAIDCYRKDLEIAQKMSDREGVGRAFGNMGNAYASTGEYQKAINSYSKHLQIAEEFGERRGMGNALGNMGNAYNCVGEYQKAIDCYGKHLEIAKEIGDSGGARRALANMGCAYENIGQYEKAIECHRKHVQIAKETRHIPELGIALGNLGVAYKSLGQYEKAIACHRKSLEIAEKVGNREGVGKSFVGMGNGYHGIGLYQEAINCHHSALDIAKEIGDKKGTATALENLGSAYYSTGRYKKAIDCFCKVLEISEEIGDILGTARAQSLTGLCYRGNDFGSACSFLANSILSFQTIRLSLTNKDEYNTSMANTFAVVHKFLFESLLDLKQVKAALLVSDSGKAKALNDLTKGDAFVFVDTTPEDKYVFKTISDNPSSRTTESLYSEALAKVIRLTKDGSIISYTFGERSDLHAWVISKQGVFHKQWKTANGLSAKTYLTTVNSLLHESLAQTFPRNAIACPDVKTVKRKKVDQFTELALSGPNNKKDDIFTVDLEQRVQNLTRVNDARERMKRKETLRVKRLTERYNLDSPKKSGIENQKDEEKCLGCYTLDRPNITRICDRTSAGCLRSKSGEDKAAASANYLKKQYLIFISPIEEYLAGSKILIVPEGSLFKLPFCAFLNSKNEHLCDRYNLQFTPALHVLNASLLKPLPKLGNALFVGNPKVGKVLFAGEIVPVLPLPNAAIEATECSKYFSAKPLLENSATKENTLKNMKDASIVHIAAHGHMDHADIFLAPNEGAPNPPNEEHYLLTAKDVLDSTLKARLVVLSCCHSGRGQISAEGVVGIARSFLGAGARSVLTSLWRIEDKPGMEFMKLFYEKICLGLPVCVALQQVMIVLKKKYPVPAWAPFQIVGEDIALTQKDIEEIRRQTSPK